MIEVYCQRGFKVKFVRPNSRFWGIVSLLLFVKGAQLWAEPAALNSQTGVEILEVKPKHAGREFSVPKIPVSPPQIQQWPLSVKDDTPAMLQRLRQFMSNVRLLEVWSLDPNIADPDKVKPAYARLYPFHGYHVIGREELKNKEEIRDLLFSVVLSIADSTEETAECFVPRHGLRIYDDKGFLDLVICYTCGSGRLYEGKEEGWFATAKNAEADFDEVFRKLKLRKAD